jgi:hypothetical protein
MVEGYINPIWDQINLIKNRLDMLEAKGNPGAVPQLTIARINNRLDQLEAAVKQPVPAPLAPMKITSSN